MGGEQSALARFADPENPQASPYGVGDVIVVTVRGDGPQHPERMLAVPAAQTARWFELAAAAYGDAFPCLQMVWPDKEKRWPWDEGARDAFVKSQPLLGPLPQ